jgi:hypothetical protein
MILTILLLLVSQNAADAQRNFQMFASVSSDTMLPQDNTCYTDEIIMYDNRDVWPRVYLPRSAFQAMLPDLDADGLFDFPAGIDALSLQVQPNFLYTNYFSFRFSTDRNGPGYLDGDILALDQQGGLRIVFSEGQLANDLALSGGHIDIDALCIKSNDEYLLSLRDGVQSLMLGAVDDGDIISWNPHTGDVQIYTTEAQMQTWVDHALPGTSSIGDVKSLSYDHQRQAVLFSVQSPSDSDATVFSSANNGSVFHEQTEQQWQFRVPTELDALCLAKETVVQSPILSVSVPYVQAGSYVNLRIRHAIPGANIVGVCSSVYKITLWPGASVGFSALSRHASYFRKWPAEGRPELIADMSGTANYSFRLPLLPRAVNEAQVYYQARVDGQGLTSPLKMKISR